MIAHWDEVEPQEWALGPMQITRIDLGTAVDSDRIGVGLVKIHPGGRSSPAHMEMAEEEIFYVLRGTGLLWQEDESGITTCEVGEGDTIVHAAESEFHTLIAGDDGLDVLAFGQRVWFAGTWLHAGPLEMRMGAAIDVSTDPDPWQRKAGSGDIELPPPGARPKNVVALADAPVIVDGAVRILGATGGSVRTGLNTFTQTAEGPAYVPHCHSAEEEIFVVLEGSGTFHAGEEVHELRAGHAVSRRPGTGVPHWFNPGPEGMTHLAYGTREPNDIVYYPQSGEVLLCGVGIRLKANQTGR